MPSLEWIGKDKVVNHHLEVPYHVLERQYSYDEDGQQTEDNGSENMIIHGDNLLALKSLLPKYEGRISCIYIDPPYNTGNEGWVYNDNVRDPRIEKWLGEVVGKEGDDLSRHDKWLCMMYPRLKLLQRLLADDGTIFVSIDDIEAMHLKLLMDEIFGKNKFMAILVWKSRQNKDNRNVTNISIDHEYVLCYGTKLKGCKRDSNRYSNPDNDPRGPWTSANMVGLATENERPNLHYDLINPETGINYGKPLKGWRYDRNTMAKLIDDNKILWPSSPDGRPRKKQFFSELSDSYTGYSSLIGKDCYTSNGTKEQLEIFGSSIFAFPKSKLLVSELLNQATDKDSIILDSFAGSGTTAHAVLDMNAKDGGNRHFILVEMEDYADSITAERVKRAIQGYPTNKKDVLYDTAITTKNIKDGGDLFAEAKEIADDAKNSYDKVEGPKMVDGHLKVIGIERAKEHQKGTGGNFSFYELGEPLFHGELLNEEVTIDTIREYIYFMETRQSLSEEKADEPYYLGSYVGTAYYFCYEKDEATTLNREFLHTVKTKADHYVIYADRCTLSDAELAKFQITFKKIPRDIARL